MIKNFMGTMFKGGNAVDPVMLLSKIDGEDRLLYGLSNVLLLIEGDYISNVVKIEGQPPSGGVLLWRFDESERSIPVSGELTINTSDATIADGSTVKIGVLDNDKSYTRMLSYVKSVKSNSVPCGSWKDGGFHAMPGSSSRIDKRDGSLVVDLQDTELIVDPDLVREYLSSALQAGRQTVVCYHAKSMTYNIQLRDKAWLVIKTQYRSKSKMPENTTETVPTETAAEAASATASTPTVDAAAVQTVQTAQTAPADAQPVVKPAVESVSKPTSASASPMSNTAPIVDPGFDDLLAAVASIEEAFGAMKANIAGNLKTVKMIIKSMAKKTPSKDLDVKYKDLEAKFNELKDRLGQLASFK